MIIENIDDELLDFNTDSSTSNLAKTSMKVYSGSVKKFLKEQLDVTEADNYINFLQNHVVLHYQHEDGTGKQKRNIVYFDALIKYVFFKRKNDDDKINKNKYTKILKLLKENKPRQFENKKVCDYLTIKQRSNVIRNLKKYKHQLIAKLCMELGVRIGSVLRLKAEANKPAINFHVVEGRVAGVIDFYGMKGGKFSRKYIFNKDLVDELKMYLDQSTELADSEYYFLETNKSYKDQKLEILINTNYHWYWTDLKKSLEICGYNSSQWSTHSFRKNAAEDIYKETRDPYAVKEFLDHADMRATEHYLKSQGLLKDKINLQLKYAEKIEKEKLD